MLGMLTGNLPIGWLVVLEKLSPDMFSGIEPRNDRIENAGRSVHDVERRMKAMVADLAGGNGRGVFVRDPPGVHAVHVNAVGMIVGSGGACHHIERGLGHVRVRMPGR